MFTGAKIKKISEAYRFEPGTPTLQVCNLIFLSKLAYLHCTFTKGKNFKACTSETKAHWIKG
jgi:hypothetical protein